MLPQFLQNSTPKRILGGVPQEFLQKLFRGPEQRGSSEILRIVLQEFSKKFFGNFQRNSLGIRFLGEVRLEFSEKFPRNWQRSSLEILQILGTLLREFSRTSPGILSEAPSPQEFLAKFLRNSWRNSFGILGEVLQEF